MENPMKGIAALVPVEELAEEILRDRSEIVALDKRRNENREGLRGLQKCSDKKVWMTVGPLLMKLPMNKTKAMLEDDMKTSDVEINKLRSNLKVKVSKLRDLEFQEPIPGLDLKPLSKEEFSGVGQVLGYHA